MKSVLITAGTAMAVALVSATAPLGALGILPGVPAWGPAYDAARHAGVSGLPAPTATPDVPLVETPAAAATMAQPRATAASAPTSAPKPMPPTTTVPANAARPTPLPTTAAVARPTVTREAPLSSPTTAALPRSAQPSLARATIASPTATVATRPSPAPADANQGLVFGTPALIKFGGLTLVGVPVTNTTDQVDTFTAKATFKKGDQIVATAVGAVNDLLPGQQRAAALVSSSMLSDAYDSVRVDVDTLLSRERSTPAGDVARKVKFGPPSTTGGLVPTVAVEVTNSASAPNTLTVQDALSNIRNLIAIATGAVNALVAGHSKTSASLGGVIGADDITLAVDAGVPAGA